MSKKASIFSLSVAAFLIESYKKLTPDSGDRNSFYLSQISQQLAGLANGTSVPPQAFSSSPPSTPIVWVNAIWLLSFVFSVMSALSATMTQQWARRYLQLPQVPKSPSERARVRSFLFFGAQSYGMLNAVEMPPTLLHISVFLFFSGLVIFFFTVYKTIAIVASIALGIFGLVYLMLTILPCIDRRCPYRTPFSAVCWYLWHTVLISITLFLRGLLRQLHYCFVPYNLGEVTSSKQRILTQLLETTESYTVKYWKYLKYGFRGGIVQAALDAPVMVDLKAITWLFKLPVLAEKGKVQGLISRIPGDTIAQLMSGPVESGRVIFRDHLLTLLRSCAPGTAGLDEITRRRRLLICLNAVLDIVKPSSVRGGLSPPESVVIDVRTNFANIGLMRGFWADTDPSIRLLSRSICALLARRLLRKPQLEQSELAWLQDVMGKPSNTIYNTLNSLPTLDSMNLDAYIYGVLSRQTDDLPINQATSFVETLTILSNGGRTSEIVFHRLTLEGGITAFIQRADGQDNHLRDVVGRLRRIYDGVFPGHTLDSQTSYHPHRSSHGVTYHKRQ
jgi:hypothetical protein